MRTSNINGTFGNLQEAIKKASKKIEIPSMAFCDIDYLKHLLKTESNLKKCIAGLECNGVFEIDHVKVMIAKDGVICISPKVK